MNTTLLKMECLPDLHVDSGESNYNIIDNEVQKDLNGNPTVHSSGIKGAMREYFSEHLDNDSLKKIFGKPSTKDDAVGGGMYKFCRFGSSECACYDRSRVKRHAISFGLLQLQSVRNP